MCKVKDYPGLYMKAKEIVRFAGINPAMPGHEMLVRAVVICKVQGTKDLYNAIARETSVVPALKNLTPEEEERHPIKQLILEAMRSAGIEDNVKVFIQDLANQI